MSKSATGYEAAYSFYATHYEVIGEWSLIGKKIRLGKRDKKVCRFCGQGCPEVTFKKEAHAIPESLGNKSLYTTYECDACNQMFGQGIENDFGNWSKPMRNFTGSRGKKGVPTIKIKSAGGSQGKFETMKTEIQQNPADPTPIFQFDEKANAVNFWLRRDPYTPVAVLKTFVRIGLSVLPEEEMPNFRDILLWIRNPNHHANPITGYPILRTFIPGSYTFRPSLFLLRRKKDEILAPYVTFVLGYGNEVFQVWLQSAGRDRHIMGTKITVPSFPVVYTDESDQGVLSTMSLLPEMIDLTDGSLVENDIVPITIQFDTISQEPLKAMSTAPHSQYQTLNLRVIP